MVTIKLILMTEAIIIIWCCNIASPVYGVAAPPQIRQRPAVTSEEGRDYLSLDEDDEFPEESIATLRRMAESFRSGLASALTQGGAAADGVAEARNGGDSGGGSGGEDGGGSGGQVMKYIMQIFRGFQQMRKSARDMFQQIATAGGQRLAARIQNRLSGWIRQSPSQLQKPAESLPNPSEDLGQNPSAGSRVPF